MPTRFFVQERQDYQEAKPFGTAGPYEFIVARVVTDAGEGLVEVLKPRQPANGNGTFVFEVNRKAKGIHPDELLNQGHTFVHVLWKDRVSLLKGIQEILNFLRVTGGPMLLGDQRRFAKRLLVANGGDWLPQFQQSGLNRGTKDQTLVDGTWPPGAAQP